MTIRAIFLGSPEFAVPSLRALHSDPRIEVSLVVTQPDRPAGRGRKMTPPAVRSAADALGIPVLQPESLRDSDVVEHLRSHRPDVLVVVAYGELLGSDVLNLAPHGALNVHPSLLPRFRGAAPIPAAILAGDAETGVSIIKLVRRLDAGPIIAQRPVQLADDETAGDLSDRLAGLAADVLPDTVVGWVNGELEADPQDEERATYAGEWTRDDARIDWNRPAIEIERLVRAANPWPVAWTTVDEEPLRILVAKVGCHDQFGDPGLTVKSGKVVLVQTGNGVLDLRTVQPAGRKAMDALSWWNGLRQDKVILGR